MKTPQKSDSRQIHIEGLKIDRRVLWVLRAAFVCVVGFGVYQLYVRAPRSDIAVHRQSKNVVTRVSVKLREQDFSDRALDNVTARFAPVDVLAVEREFRIARLKGETVDEFIRRKTGGRELVSARFDDERANVELPPGRWWVYLTIKDRVRDEEISWRLPINVRGQTQTVELNRRNAYLKAQAF